MDIYWRVGRVCAIVLLCAAATAMADDHNGRSHEPNLRQLTAELDGLRDLVQSELKSLRAIMDERDKFYTERAMRQGIAVDAALAANKELAANSSANSKEAIVKAENSQKLYDEAHNDLIKKGQEEARHFVSRAEVEASVKNLEEKIARLEADVRLNREAMTTTLGRGEGRDQFWNYLLAVLGVIFVAIAGIWALYVFLHSRDRKGD